MELDNVEDDLNVLETTVADIEKFIVAGNERSPALRSHQ